MGGEPRGEVQTEYCCIISGKSRKHLEDDNNVLHEIVFLDDNTVTMTYTVDLHNNEMKKWKQLSIVYNYMSGITFLCSSGIHHIEIGRLEGSSRVLQEGIIGEALTTNEAKIKTKKNTK